MLYYYPYQITSSERSEYNVFIGELFFEYNITDKDEWGFSDINHLVINNKSIEVQTFDNWKIMKKRESKLETILQSVSGNTGKSNVKWGTYIPPKPTPINILRMQKILHIKKSS